MFSAAMTQRIAKREREETIIGDRYNCDKKCGALLTS